MTEQEEKTFTISQSTTVSLALSFTILTAVVGAALWMSKEIGGLDKRFAILEERMTSVISLQQEFVAARRDIGLDIQAVKTENVKLSSRLDNLETRLQMALKGQESTK